MNKWALKKKIKGAAKAAGIRMSRREVSDAADVIVLFGGISETNEALREYGSTKQYIGTKIVQAAPALRIESGDEVRIELLADKPVTMPTDTVDMGYKVIYPDGYESWSPIDAFEQAYRRTDGMNFGLALEAAAMGKKIARRGWNGKGMFVVLGNCYDVVVRPELREFDEQAFCVDKFLVMHTAQGTLQPGWLASQADMLADDWYIVE